MNISTDTTLRLSRVIKAEPQAVFAAWTEPALLQKWSCPEGATLAEVQVDLRVGGAFLLRMRSGEDGRHTAFGEYREIVPPHRLVYTWDWKEPEYAMGETLITVEFRAHGQHTEVLMVHERMPTLELREAHNQGWTSCLDKLAAQFG